MGDTTKMEVDESLLKGIEKEEEEKYYQHRKKEKQFER